MKNIKVMVTAVIVMAAMSVSGQTWNTIGDHIYNTNSGWVGIGTSNVGAPLHILNPTGGSILALERDYTGTSGVQEIGSLLMVNSGSGDMAYYGFRKNGTFHDMVQSVYDATSGTWRAFSYFNVATHKFEIQDGVADAEYKNTGDIIFNNGGGVVIGNTSVPSGVKLAVDGKIIATEVEITLDAWPDYVFEDSYNLKSLTELEEFIKVNKHLPGIPTERDIIDNGLNIGEMNKILIEKVEELTLYVIELQKEVKQLKQK